MADRISVPTPAGYRKAAAVTPSNTVQLPFIARALYIGGAGTLAVKLLDDSVDTSFGAVTAGSIIPITCSHVRATGTSATSIVALA